MSREQIFEKVRLLVNELVMEGADKIELSEVLETFAQDVEAWAKYDKIISSAK